MTTTLRGKVKWFNEQRGFGFIIPYDEIADECFVHYKQIIGKGFRTLLDGAEVEFQREKGPKGWAARNVKVIGQ